MAFPTFDELVDIIKADDVDSAAVVAALEADMADADKVKAGHRMVNGTSTFQFHVLGHITDSDVITKLIKDLGSAGFIIKDLSSITGRMPPNSQDRIFNVEGEGNSSTKWSRLVVAKKPD